MFQDGNYLFTEPGQSGVEVQVSAGIFSANGRQWQVATNPANHFNATIDLVGQDDTPVLLKKFGGAIWRSFGNTHILAKLAI
jgi:hypothetical protein